MTLIEDSDLAVTSYFRTLLMSFIGDGTRWCVLGTHIIMRCGVQRCARGGAVSHVYVDGRGYYSHVSVLLMVHMALFVVPC